MENEIRYYFSTDNRDKLLSFMESQNLKKIPKVHELTIQYDHCDPRYSFYNKDVDGRLRLRISEYGNSVSGLLSWKQRTADTFNQAYNSEIEKEVRISGEDIANFQYIIENIMRFHQIESYERYRTVFEDQDISISIDEYPFGIALEIESRNEENSDTTIPFWVEKLGLQINDAYRLSWDDKYAQLCLEQNIPQLNHIRFGDPMPKL